MKIQRLSGYDQMVVSVTDRAWWRSLLRLAETDTRYIGEKYTWQTLDGAKVSKRVAKKLHWFWVGERTRLRRMQNTQRGRA